MTVCKMGTGYLRVYLGNTRKRDIRTGELSQYPEFIYAPNEEELALRMRAWRKAQRGRM